MDQKKPKSSSLDSNLPIDYLNQVSTFETLRSYGGKFFRLDEHIERLYQSNQGMARKLPLPKKEFKTWVLDSLMESKLKDTLLRVSVHFDQKNSVELVAIFREFHEYPEKIYENGVELQTTISRRPNSRAQSSQIKSSQYVSGVLAALDLSGSSARDFIFLNTSGSVSEGSVSNIFILKSKRILTPSDASGILKGVTRQFVIELAQKNGFQVLETVLTRHELYSSQECFLTNTSSEVLPVVQIDGRVIGAGSPGPVAKKLRKDFRKSVFRELR